MAEGWANALLSENFSAESAGVEKHGMNAKAILVMDEAGVNIQTHRSKLIHELNINSFDCVITVCSHAHESCPVPSPNCRVIHESFDDPPRLAKDATTEEEKLDCYRRVRDQIKEYILKLPVLLKNNGDKHE
jgi:arsenate reductase (thioredoxin)